MSNVSLDSEVSEAEVSVLTTSSETLVAPSKDPNALTEAQVVMKSFEHYTTQLIMTLNDYEGSKRQVTRAWSTAAFAPFNKEEPTFSYPAEKEIFDLAMEQNSAKLLLMVYGLEEAGMLKILKPLVENAAPTESEKELAAIEATLAPPSETI